MHLLLGLCARRGEEALRGRLEAGVHRALQALHGADLQAGFGRIAVSEKDAPNMLVDLV